MTKDETTALPADEISATAADAWVFAYPMLQNYQTLFRQAIDDTFPGYVGGFNRFRHYARAYTPADTDIVTANNDTPYSWAWLDLRAEPVALTYPEVAGDRYVTFQLFDLFTFNFAYVGVLSTGRQGGTYLIAGPDWDGETPDGVDGVLRSESRFVGILGRTALDGPLDLPNVVALQEQYELTPLHELTGDAVPDPAERIDWPAWDEKRALSLDFIGLLNFLLTYTQPIHPSEIELFDRFARIGIAAGQPFDADALDQETRDALGRGVATGAARLKEAVFAAHDSRGYFGTREQMTGKYLERAVGAAVGIYGNSPQEAIYLGWHELDGAPLIGANRYEIRFETGELPPVELFWSITLYALPSRLLVANPIDRYSIGDRTDGLVHNQDGSLTLVVSHDEPSDPADRANWLPAPEGAFNLVFRLYGPGEAVIDGSWSEPPIEKI